MRPPMRKSPHTSASLAESKTKSKADTHSDDALDCTAFSASSAAACVLRRTVPAARIFLNSERCDASFDFELGGVRSPARDEGGVDVAAPGELRAGRSPGRDTGGESGVRGRDETSGIAQTDRSV